MKRFGFVAKPLFSFLSLFFLLFSLKLQAQKAQFQLVKKEQYVLQVDHQLAEVEASRQLKVYVGSNLHQLPPPMAGKYQQEAQRIFFMPSFGFRPGMVYSAVFHQDTFHFTIPGQKNVKSTEVLGFYPSADTVPANLLKVYLEFSAPMSEGMAYEHIHLINENGDTIYQPFLLLQPELWDETRQRLTLWLDPGRVKRDLGPNLLHGAPLEQGQNFRFCLSKGLKDQNGQSLKKDFQHLFYVSQADRASPDVREWKLEISTKRTRNGLSIIFPDPLDYALLQHTIVIFDNNRQAVPGQIKIEPNETSWVFTPDSPWNSGPYQIRIESKLEDLAGNNLNRLFDRDLKSTSTRPDKESVYYWISFDIPN